MEIEDWLTAPVMFAALTVAQIFHSLEEIITGLYKKLPIVTGRLHDLFDFVPQLRISRMGFALANAVLVTFMLTISILLFRRVPWATRVARAVAFAEILNGAAHLAIAIIRRGYFPGAVSAIGLVIFGVLFFREDSLDRVLSELERL